MRSEDTHGQWVCTPIVHTHCPQVLRAKHLWTMSLTSTHTHCPQVLRAKHLWTIDVHTHCPHPFSTGPSREAPVNNGCAHPLSEPIVHRCFARSTCGQWMCTPIVHTHCPCSTPIHPQGIYPHPRYSLFGVHAQVSSIFSNTNCSHTAGASRVP